MKRGSFKKAFVYGIILFSVVVFNLQMVSARTNLTMWHCWGTARHADIEAQAEAYMRVHGDVSIEILNMSCGQIFERYQVAFVADIAPDIIMIHSHFLPTAALNGFLTDLTGHIDRAGIVSNDFIFSDYMASTWEGSFYGMPVRTGADENTLLYYSTDAFGRAGLDTESPPKTWSELVDIGRKLVIRDGDDLRRAAVQVAQSDFPFTGWLYSGGGKLISDDGSRIETSSETSIDTFFDFLNMADVISNQRLSPGVVPEAEFVNGYSAMLAGGGRAFELIKRVDPDFQFRIAVKPQRDEGHNVAGVHVGTWHYAISSTTPSPVVAWDFLKWITTEEETIGRFLLNQGRPSALMEFNRNLDYLEINPDFLVIYEAMEKAAALPFVPGIRNIINEYERTVNNVLRGNIAPGAAVEEFSNTQQLFLEESMRNVRR